MLQSSRTWSASPFECLSCNFILPDDSDLVPCFGDCFQSSCSGICATYCTLSRETKEECAGKDVFLLEIAKGRALDGSAPFDSEGGYVVVKLEFIFFSVNKSYLSVEYLLHILDGHNYP